MENADEKNINNKNRSFEKIRKIIRRHKIVRLS